MGQKEEFSLLLKKSNFVTPPAFVAPGLTHLIFNLLILYVFVFAVVKNIETSCQEKQYVTFLDASALFVAP